MARATKSAPRATEPARECTYEATEVRLLDVSSVDQWSGNPRGAVARADVEDILDSVRVQGVLQPIVVRGKSDAKFEGDGRWEVIDGARRLVASIETGYSKIPAVVRQLDDVQATELALVSNSNRRPPHPLRESRAYARLVQDGGLSPAEIAHRLGVTPRHVARRLALASMDAQVAAAGLDPATVLGSLDVGSLEDLACIAPAAQLELATSLGWLERSAHGPELVPDREAVRRHLGEASRGLKLAPWSLDDETLLPEAGSCESCHKHTRARPELFDFDPPKDLARATCLDSTCWARKAAAQLARGLQTARDKHGAALQLAHGRCLDGGLRANEWTVDAAQRSGALPPGERAARLHDLKPAKRGERGASPHFVVDGVEAGRVLWLSDPNAAAKGGPNGSHSKKVSAADAKPATPAARRVAALAKLDLRRKAWAIAQVRSTLLDAIAPVGEGSRRQSAMLAAATAFGAQPSVTFPSGDLPDRLLELRGQIEDDTAKGLAPAWEAVRFGALRALPERPHKEGLELAYAAAVALWTVLLGCQANDLTALAVEAVKPPRWLAAQDEAKAERPKAPCGSRKRAARAKGGADDAEAGPKPARKRRAPASSSSRAKKTRRARKA